MSRDPFEEMQRRNPVTPEELPVAPMSVAERVLGARVARATPGWAMAAVAMVVAAVIGGGILLWLGGGDAAPVGSGGTTTSTGAGPSTTTPGVTSTVAVPESGEAVLYLFLDQSGEGWNGGPYLVPVAVELFEPSTATGAELVVEEAAVTMQRLLEGVGDLVRPGLSTAIPSGTELDGVEYDEQSRVVGVHLSGEFVSGGGSASMLGRLGQVVYTLTRIDRVQGVRFFIDGVATTVFGGEGVTVDDPATRQGFDDLLAAVMIESPADGQLNLPAPIRRPLMVSGTANVFEATVGIELLDASGVVIFEGFTTATCGTGCRGEWEIEIPYEVSEVQHGTLRAFEASAEDGRPLNVREHRVLLVPADGTGDTTTTSIVAPTCSGGLVGGELAEQPGLPETVAEKRAAIRDAAVACDWDELQSLLGPSFAYSYGGQDASIDAPIHYWQDLDDAGDPVIRFLAELLNQPFGTLEGGEGLTHYVWPSAHTKGWDEVTEAEREALRVLYDDADLAGFEAFGAYYGYRIGILSNGDWMYFIAGD